MKKALARTPVAAIAVAAITAAGLAAPGTADAQIQLTPDSGVYLIQRFVAPNQQWAITYNPEAGTMTGNVFKTDGGDPSFIWCQFTDIQYAADPADNKYTLDCFGSDACTAAPCEASQWKLIASDLPLPASFVLPPNTKATFGGQIEPIFNQSCALPGCHDANTASAGLILDQGVAYDNILMVMSTQRQGEDRVNPFDPNTSYLFAKVNGTGEGSRMPLGGMLTQPEIDAIEVWIKEGAVRN